MHPQDMKPVPMYQRARFLETENERLLQEQEAIAKALGLKQEPFMLADHVSALVEHLDMANEERAELQAENERLEQELAEAREAIERLELALSRVDFAAKWLLMNLSDIRAEECIQDILKWSGGEFQPISDDIPF